METKSVCKNCGMSFTRESSLVRHNKQGYCKGGSEPSLQVIVTANEAKKEVSYPKEFKEDKKTPFGISWRLIHCLIEDTLITKGPRLSNKSEQQKPLRDFDKPDWSEVILPRNIFAQCLLGKVWPGLVIAAQLYSDPSHPENFGVLVQEENLLFFKGGDWHLESDIGTKKKIHECVSGILKQLLVRTHPQSPFFGVKEIYAFERKAIIKFRGEEDLEEENLFRKAAGGGVSPQEKDEISSLLKVIEGSNAIRIPVIAEKTGVDFSIKE